jgi:hypothetical protein
LSVLVLGGLALVACGDDDGGHDAHGAEHDGHMHGPDTTCGRQANCMGTETLAEGLSADGEDGIFSVSVVSHNDLSTLDNEWVIEVTDADGQPVDDAEVTVSTFSVDCGHPGPSAPAMVTANADGNYEVEPDNAHGGPWDTIFEIEAGGEADSVTLHLCVPGDEHEMGVVDGGAHMGMHDG